MAGRKRKLWYKPKSRWARLPHRDALRAQDAYRQARGVRNMRLRSARSALLRWRRAAAAIALARRRALARRVGTRVAGPHGRTIIQRFLPRLSRR